MYLKIMSYESFFTITYLSIINHEYGYDDNYSTAHKNKYPFIPEYYEHRYQYNQHVTSYGH